MVENAFKSSSLVQRKVEASIILCSVILSLLSAGICGGPNGPSASGQSCDACGASATYLESISNNIRTITTTGCPNHYSVCTGKQGITGCGGVRAL